MPIDSSEQASITSAKPAVMQAQVRRITDMRRSCSVACRPSCR
jgi:hypothetical protein